MEPIQLRSNGVDLKKSEDRSDKYSAPQCILKDFSKSVQCSNKNTSTNRLQTETSKEKMLNDEILKRAQEKRKVKAVKNLSMGLSFESNVISERTPYAGSYTSGDLKKLTTDIDKLKRNKKSVNHSSYYNKRHMPCHLTPMVNEADEIVKLPDRCVSEESFWLGASDNEERMKRIPLSENTTPKKSPEKPVKSKIQGHEPFGWEEHVLSLISKSTADIIIKDYTIQNQIKLKGFLENHNKEKLPKESSIITEEKEEPVSTDDKRKYTDSLSVHFKESQTMNLKQPLKQFKPVLQQSFPMSPENWSKNITNVKTKHTLKKGLHKWAGYPQEIKEEGLELQQIHHDSIIPHKREEIEFKVAVKQRNNSNLLSAVDEWRSKWLLEKKWKTKSLEELKEAMASINDHVRLAAVSAAGKAILDKRDDKSIDEDVLQEQEDEIIKEIKLLFDDRSFYVSIAAAIALFSIDRADQQATNLLLETVKKGAQSERWIAAQCLAEYDHHDDCVIIELLSHVLNGADPLKRRRVEIFLQRLSNLTDTIQYMLSEKLHSTSWKDRIMACQLFPILSGTLKKDVANKLSYLTWHDWNKEVRMAAAKALGRTGNGKLVHDALCKYLKSPKPAQQVESLRKIANLGIITAQLMVPFLNCLNSSHFTVCMEALRVVRIIHLCSDGIIKALLSLSSSNQCLKIKLSALKTLGLVGSPNDEFVRERLLWCMRFEKERCLRQAACEAIGNIKICDKEIANTMQDMLVVEDNDSFRSLLSSTLNSFGYEETCDEGMITVVQERVKKLCAKDNVLLHVLTESEDDDNLMTLYLEQQDKQTKQESIGRRSPESISTSHHSNINDDDEDGYEFENDVNKITTRRTGGRAFDATLEGYRARQISPPCLEFPDIEPSYIPYWTESNSSIQSVER